MNASDIKMVAEIIKEAQTKVQEIDSNLIVEVRYNPIELVIQANTDREPDILEIIQTSCGYLKIEIDAIRSSSRNKELVMYRNIIIYILRKDHGFALTAIARAFFKDHSTIIHSISQVELWQSIVRSYEHNLEIFNSVREALKTLKTISQIQDQIK